MIDLLPAHRNAPAVGRELHRVADQIPQGLVQTLRVAGDRRKVLQGDHRDVQVAFWADLGDVLDDALDQRVEEDRRVGQFQALGVDQRHVQNVLNRLAQPFGRVGDASDEVAWASLIVF